ncbi:MAG: prepilin peptidase CpaA [Rhodospirillaceae bacterium]|jgi:prepilin peptidase CpaA|nr:prepilin peptidase CpaA [Rhodospirillaceae bacterium]
MSLFGPLQTGCLVAFALLLLLAAWQDLRTMHIADAVSLAIVVAFAVWALSGLVRGTLSFTAVGLALACAAVVFGAGAAAFAAGALGGGDVKLLTAASLFAGLGLISDFLLVTALVGGALGVAVLAGAPVGPLAPAADATLRTRLRGGLPYGPAIAAGGLWVAGSLALQ